MTPILQLKDLDILSPSMREIAEHDEKDMIAILICAFLAYEYNLDYNNKNNSANIETLVTQLTENYNLTEEHWLIIFSFIYIITQDPEYRILSSIKLNSLDLTWLINRYYNYIEDQTVYQLYKNKMNECVGLHEQLDFFVKLIDKYMDAKKATISHLKNK